MSEKFKSAPDVIVLDSNGNNLGTMRIGAARALAREQELDLVEISRQKGVSVYKIMDEGKWKYDQKKKAKRNHIHVAPQKEIKFRMKIDTHDQDIKIKKIAGFLAKGSDVRIVVEMRGRERGNPKAAGEKLHTILSTFADHKHEPIRKTSSNVSTVLHPVKGCHGKEESGRKNKDTDSGRSEGIQAEDRPDGRRQGGASPVSSDQKPVQSSLRAVS